MQAPFENYDAGDLESLDNSDAQFDSPGSSGHFEILSPVGEMQAPFENTDAGDQGGFEKHL